MTAQNVAGTPCQPQPECRVVSDGEGGKATRPRRLSGLARIVGEREEQLARWSAEIDDRYVSGELVEAAAHLLTAVQLGCERMPGGHSRWSLVERHPNPIARLTIAGALIAAEIDRRARCERRELDADDLARAARSGTPERHADELAGQPCWIVEGSCESLDLMASPVVFGHGFTIPLVGDLDWTFARDREHATRFGSRETAERAMERMRQGGARFSREVVDGTRIRRVTADYTFRAIEVLAVKHALNLARTWPDWRTVPADQPIEHVRPAPTPTAQPEPLAPDGEARTNQLPEGTTHITAGMRIEEGPARGLDGVQLSWHYHIVAWPSGITLECGLAPTIETLRAACRQCWDGRSVELLIVRGSGVRQQIGGVVYTLAPQVLGVDLRVLGRGSWKWQRKVNEPTVQVWRRPESLGSLEKDCAELAIYVLKRQGELDPDGDEDDDQADVEDSVDELWEAVNRYAQACGGDTSDASTGAARMDAVVAVGKAVTARIAAAGNLVGGRKLFLVQDGDRPMHVVAHDWQAAIAAWKRVVVDCDDAEEFQEPAGVQLVCGAEDLLIEGEEVDRG